MAFIVWSTVRECKFTQQLRIELGQYIMKINEKMSGSILNNLSIIVEELPVALKRLALYILDNPESVIAKNLADIAKIAQVGEATVVRLAKTLHYPGFKEFQIELAMELAGKMQQGEQILDSNISDEDDCFMISKKLKLSISRSLDENIRNLNESELKTVADAIYKANKVFIIGVGNSCLSALFLKNKLSRIGIDAQCESMTHFMYTSLSMLKPGDVVIAISQKGTSYETRKGFEIGKETGALAVAITNNPNSPLAKIADHVLYNGNEEGFLQGDSAATITAQFHMCELLYSMVVAFNRSKASKTKQMTLKALGKEISD